MKYILIFLFALLCSVGYAQFPVNQTLGAPTTLVTSRGGLRADSSLILPQFPDTAAANRSPYIKFYPGNMIRVYNDVYMRNTTATKWQLVNPSGGGTNNAIDSLRIINDSVYARKYGVFVYQYKTPTTDTTSLSNRINLKLNISDTAAMLAPYSIRINSKIDSLYKIGDSVFARKNGVFVFQYLDVSQNILVNNGLSFSGDTIQLGGRLSKNTNINQANNDFTFDSTKNFTVIDVNGWDRVGVNQTQSFLNKGGIGGASTVLVDNQKAKLSSTDGVDKTSQINVYPDSVEVYPNEGKLYTNVPSNVDTIGYYPLKYNPSTGKIEAYAKGFNQLGVDTTSLSNRINERIDSLKRSNDSVYARKNGVFVFQYRDSVGNAGGGGGGGKIYYLNGGVSLGTFGGIPMYELGDTAVIGTAANFTRNTTGNIANFITDVGKPGLLQIPSGVWTIDAFLSETGGGSNHAQIYAVLEKWNGTTLTTIATSPVEEITNGNTPDLYTYSISVPTTTISVTDRIVIQFYIQNTNGKTVTLYTQNGYVGEVHTTFTTGIGSLNGLVTPSQTFATGTSGTDFNIQSVTSTHTFNLPTASATNRGALSSTDWTTFNGKLNPSDTTSLSNRINTKLNISDTSAMLSPYLRSIDTANRFVTSVFRKTASDSVFFVRGGSNNFAFKDSTGASGWGLLGNSGTNSTTNFLGTTDNVNLIFRRNNVISGRIDSTNANNGITSFGFRTTGTGTGTTAFGYKSLQNSTGTNNTAFGNRAGLNMTSGFGNTLIGDNAGRTMSDAGVNTAVGFGALSSVNDWNNTAIGGNALSSLVSGQRNIGIGYYSGAYQTSGSNQIYINSIDRFNLTDERAGSPFYAQQNLTVANQIVTLNGRIGINTISPSASAGLEVSSTTQGFLQPRLTTTQMNAISTPATGLSVFNTTDSVEYVYRGTTSGWQKNVVYNRNNDVALFNGANQRIMIDTTTNIVAGRTLTVEAGSTQAGGTSAFQALSQTSRAYRGMGAASNGDIYVAVNGGNIFRRTGGTGNFTALTGSGSRQFWDVAVAPNGDIYATEFGGDVWKSTNNGTTWSGLGLTARQYSGVCVAPNGDVYVAVYLGDIFISTNSGASFTALSQTNRRYVGMGAASNGDIYVVTDNIGIYKRTGGTGNFTATGASSLQFFDVSVSSDGIIYAVEFGGSIWRSTDAGTTFTNMNQTTRNWSGITVASNGDIYAGVQNGDIYLQGQGTADLNGGTLVLQSGVGKGTGTSTISFNTGTTLSSGSTLQTASTKMTILGNGNVGIGTTSPSAKLELSDTARGFLQTRMTTTQRNNISSPSVGLQVFTTTDSSQYVYRGTGAGWQQLANEIFATGTLDFPNTNGQTSSDLTLTLTGAVDGDAVILGVPNAAMNANSNYSAWVSAANTITIRLNNYGTGAVNPASATFKVTIIK